MPDSERPDASSALERARRKSYRRLIPLVLVCYVIAYIDRSNVSIAKLSMIEDLGFNEQIFGDAFGFFFLGYFLLEIPGAVIVERWSARKWISRIMITWGIVAALTALVRTPDQFKWMRFALGLAEAGFFPGVIVYLTHWFTERDRARALAFIIVAQPLAQIVTPIISSPILRLGTTEVLDGVKVVHPPLLGMVGWQWVYIFWGLPAVILGIVVIFALTDRPSQARWLLPDEREALESKLAEERAAALASGARNRNFWQVITNPAVLLLAAANFSIVCSQYGTESFLPTILGNWYGLSIRQINWLVPLPYLLVMGAQLLVSWSSDRTQERWWHTAGPMFAGGVSLLLALATRGHIALTLLCFGLALGGVRSYLAPFYALPKLFLHGTAAAAAIGFINAIANLGGFVGPSVMGRVRHATGSFEGGLLFISATAGMAATFIVILRLYHRRLQRRRAEAALS